MPCGTVLDLPQLYQKPAVEELQHALDSLQYILTDFSDADNTIQVHPEGVTRYLTSIIASPLVWIDDDKHKEQIWEKASHCLTQRSGRTAMGDMTRSFQIPTATGYTPIKMHEPGLTGDDLGHKTWSSSFELAKALHTIHFDCLEHPSSDNRSIKVLELGAGTGLVGLAAALVWRTAILLTDLPEIAANLERNVQANNEPLTQADAYACSGTLDWKSPEDLTVINERYSPTTKFKIIMAADPIYSPQHPRLLVNALSSWLDRGSDSGVVLAYPLREAYVPQIEDLRHRLSVAGLASIEERTVEGRDDWADTVSHVISIWRWREAS